MTRFEPVAEDRTVDDASTDPVVASGGLALRVLDRTWAWIEGLSDLGFIACLCAFTVLRAGVSVERTEVSLLAVEQFPEPIAEYRSNSVIGSAVGHYLGVHTEQAWILLHLGVIVVGIAIIARCLASAFPTTSRVRMAAIWLSLSAVAPSVLKKLGSYDPWTVVAMALIVLPRRHRLVLAPLGGIVLGLSNAEQGLVGLACAAVLIVVLPAGADEGWSTRGRLVPLAWAAFGLVVSRAAVLVWWSHIGAEVPSRAGVFDQYLTDSLRGAGGAALAGVYTWFGVAWVLVGFAVLVAVGTQRMTFLRWLAAGGALIAVPAVATITTLDGTRVFAMVSLPALLVVIGWVDAQALGERSERVLQRVATAALLAGVVLPALVTHTGGGHWFMFPFLESGL